VVASRDWVRAGEHRWRQPRRHRLRALPSDGRWGASWVWIGRRRWRLWVRVGPGVWWWWAGWGRRL